MHRVWLGATLLFALSFGLEDSAPPPWGYDKPTEWADEHCKDATALQSPIFINKTTPLATHPHLRPVLLTTQCKFAVDSTTVLQESNFRTLEVRLPSNATSAHTPCSLIDQNSGQLYPFVRFHFHVGAEHAVEGRDADAEVHLVFQQGDNTLVVGVRLRASKSPSSVVSNFFRSTLAAPLPHGGGSRTKGLLRDIGLDDVLPASDGSYVTYEGSLTTPPCSPHVRWIVFTAVQDIPSTTLTAVKSALASYMPTTFDKFGNARPLQPQLGRPMFKFSDPTSTTINRWIVTQDEEDRIRATSLAFSDAVSISTGGSFVTRHAFGLCVAILCFATIGLFLRLRERPLEVGVSNAARDAATYGTMET